MHYIMTERLKSLCMLILREREKYSSFVFQQESDQFELCLTCKLKMTGFNGACIKCTVFSPFVYI